MNNIEVREDGRGVGALGIILAIALAASLAASGFYFKNPQNRKYFIRTATEAKNKITDTGKEVLEKVGIEIDKTTEQPAVEKIKPAAEVKTQSTFEAIKSRVEKEEKKIEKSIGVERIKSAFEEEVGLKPGKEKTKKEKPQETAEEPGAGKAENNTGASGEGEGGRGGEQNKKPGAGGENKENGNSNSETKNAPKTMQANPANSSESAGHSANPPGSKK